MSRVQAFDLDEESRRHVSVGLEVQLSLSKAAKALGWPQARLAKRRDLPKLFGFEAGGMSPFGIRTRCPLLLDEALTTEELLIGGGLPGRDLLVPQAVLVDSLQGQRAALSEEHPLSSGTPKRMSDVGASQRPGTGRARKNRHAAMRSIRDARTGLLRAAWEQKSRDQEVAVILEQLNQHLETRRSSDRDGSRAPDGLARMGANAAAEKWDFCQSAWATLSASAFARFVGWLPGENAAQKDATGDVRWPAKLEHGA
ncbi:Hypothetical protein SCF082_LOCUS32947 [Durusdinium trenchii]|uniref:YbaK/aminoacyl-tRNA synthetase-associated domain-containing protein n=1 Tax=Durusdinium trenchii TaxID=1381693 RepID=A0ABP0NJR3_9DINO